MAGSMRWRTRKPPSCHQPCVSPVSSRSLFGSAKKIWQETANNSRIVEAFEQRREEIRRSTRISLLSSRTTSGVGRRAEAGVRAAAEAQVARGSATSFTDGKADRTNTRRCRRWSRYPPLRFRWPGCPPAPRPRRAGTFRQQVFAVPVGDHHGGRGVAPPISGVRWAGVRRVSQRALPQQIRERQQRRALIAIEERRQQAAGKARSKRFRSSAMSAWQTPLGRALPCGPT